MAHNINIPVEVICEVTAGTWSIGPNDSSGRLGRHWEQEVLHLNARKIRDEFLEKKPSGPELIAYLNAHRIGEIATHVDEGVGYSTITDADLIEWRRLIPKLLTSPIASWCRLKGFDRSKLEMVHSFLERGSSLEFDLSGAVPQAYVYCGSGILESMILTVFLDRLRGDKYRECARADCDAVFRRETRHKRKFCSWYCGHLVSVRNNRAARKRKAKEG
jgi:hypothetical protein